MLLNDLFVFLRREDALVLIVFGYISSFFLHILYIRNVSCPKKTVNKNQGLFNIKRERERERKNEFVRKDYLN